MISLIWDIFLLGLGSFYWLCCHDTKSDIYIFIYIFVYPLLTFIFPIGNNLHGLTHFFEKDLLLLPSHMNKLLI